MSRLALALACAALAVAAPARAEPPVDGPWLGIAYSPGSEGVLILEVFEETAAADAGVRRGDEIVELGGAPVFPASDLPGMLGRFKVGDPMPLGVLRNGHRLRMVAVLGARPSDGELLHRRLVDKPAPDLDVARPGDKTRIDLASMRGKPVLLAFFSTRCEGCASALNRAGALVRERAPRMAVLAVSGDPVDAVSVYLQRSPITVPVAVDDIGDAVRAYTVTPADSRLFFSVVDHRGMVRYAAVVAPGDDAALAEVAIAAGRAARGAARAR